MRSRIGIEAMGVAVPRRYVDIEDLARARGVDPAKYTLGLGAREMAVAEPGEDTVALAATAAAARSKPRSIRPASACSSSARRPASITASPSPRSSTACSAAARDARLRYAARVLRRHRRADGRGRVDRVGRGCGAQRARHLLGHRALRRLRPPASRRKAPARSRWWSARTRRCSSSTSGSRARASAHVHDFWRPLGQREAQVDGHYSVQCYLDALAGAYRGWKQRAVARELVRGDGLVSERLARICYHVPFCKMARKAHVQLRRCDLDDRGEPSDAAEEAARTRAFAIRSSRRSGCARASATSIPARSTSASRACSISRPPASPESGSACSRTAAAARASSSPAWSRRAPPSASRLLGSTSVLGARERISIAEYERLMSMTAPLGETPSPGTFRFTGATDHRRQYTSA